VTQLASTFLLPNSVQVSTVTEDEDSTHTHVRQEIAYVAPDDIFVGATQLFMRAFEDDPQAKIIAFFPTAREVGVFSSMVSSSFRLAVDLCANADVLIAHATLGGIE
jgi:hypothetical protein